MNAVLALGLLGVTVYTDWKAFKIYNKHVLAGFLAGLVFHAYADGWFGLQAAVISGFAGGLILFPAWLFGAIGGGDVKLYAAIGAIMGYSFVMQMTVWLALYCLLWAVPMLIMKKRLGRSLKWTVDYLKYVLFKLAFWGPKEKAEPIIEDGTKIKFAFVIAAAVLTSLAAERVMLLEPFF